MFYVELFFALSHDLFVCVDSLRAGSQSDGETRMLRARSLARPHSPASPVRFSDAPPPPLASSLISQKSFHRFNDTICSQTGVIKTWSGGAGCRAQRGRGKGRDVIVCIGGSFDLVMASKVGFDTWSGVSKFHIRNLIFFCSVSIFRGAEICMYVPKHVRVLLNRDCGHRVIGPKTRTKEDCPPRKVHG